MFFMTADVVAVADPKRVAALLGHPIRTRIVALARDPSSSSDLAAQLRLSRQRVNYHVRLLARSGFLKRAGQRRKRNLIEQQYVATARAYVLTPAVLGPLALQGHHAEDAFSATRLIGLAAEAQADVSQALEAARTRGLRVATLSLDADVRFQSATQRQVFTEALQTAVTELIAKHTAPSTTAEGAEGSGRPYRLLIGCYPKKARETAAKRGRTQ
jgi:biotin operon repressor